jgi:hypothetical protein
MDSRSVARELARTTMKLATYAFFGGVALGLAIAVIAYWSVFL